MKRSATTHPLRRLAGLTAGVALILTTACGGSPDPAADDSARTIAGRPVDTAEAAVPASQTALGFDTVVSASEATTTLAVTAGTFVDEANALLDDVTEAGVRVGEVLDRADVTSTEWRAEATAILRGLSALLISARDLQAPLELEEARLQLIDSTALYEAATRLLADGIETLDLDKIEGAADGLADAIVAIATVRALLNAV